MFTSIISLIITLLLVLALWQRIKLQREIARTRRELFDVQRQSLELSRQRLQALRSRRH